MSRNPGLLAIGMTFALLSAVAGCGRRTDETAATTGATANSHGDHQQPSTAAVPARLAPALDTARAPGPAPAGMVWIPGGSFWMGCENCGMPDALPLHLVSVTGFWMDATPVTNAGFEAFVRATSYVTVAERRPDPKDFPGVPADKLVPGSVVFTPPAHPVSLEDFSQWWSYVPGANWRHPEGPATDVKGRERHPVVHIAWDDAAAYAAWAGKRLPTEAEFEYSRAK